MPAARIYPEYAEGSIETPLAERDAYCNSHDSERINRGSGWTECSTSDRLPGMAAVTDKGAASHLDMPSRPRMFRDAVNWLSSHIDVLNPAAPIQNIGARRTSSAPRFMRNLSKQEAELRRELEEMSQFHARVQRQRATEYAHNPRKKQARNFSKHLQAVMHNSKIMAGFIKGKHAGSCQLCSGNATPAQVLCGATEAPPACAE
eukprot:6184515-Pleurochrysis_carterae.AAC.2